MADDDTSPYTQEPPTGVDRRTFVKGAMGAAAIGVAGAAGFTLFKQAAIVQPSTIKNIKYLGAKVITGSPAPRGIPYMAVRVDDDGFVQVLPEIEDENLLDWYRYCGKENAPGLANPAFTDDNTVEYFLTEEKLVQAGDEAEARWWYANKLGEKIKASDFATRDFGSGAAFRWRSEGVSGNDILTGILLKLDPSKMDGVSEDTLAQYMDLEHSLIAVYSTCTHFCCVPGFKEDPTAEKFNAWEMIFCTCHNSRFDPLVVTEYQFDLKLEDPKEGAPSSGGGGH